MCGRFASTLPLEQIAPECAVPAHSNSANTAETRGMDLNSNGSTMQLVVADGSCHSVEVNIYRAVPNPKSTGGAWAIEWTADGVVSGHICRNLETEVDAAIMAYELAMIEARADRQAAVRSLAE